MKRNTYIDYLKGIAIIMVVLGHCWKLPQDVFRLIYSIHMPLFFAISGYLLAGREDEPLGRFIIKKAKSLLIPYIVFCLISCVFRVVILGKCLSVKEAVTAVLLGGKNLIIIFNFSLWFLPVLFISIVLFKLLLYFKKREYIVGISVLILFVISPRIQAYVYSIYNSEPIPQMFHVIPAAVLCLGVGYLCGRIGYLDRIQNKKTMNIAIVAVLAPIAIALTINNTEQMLHFETFLYMPLAFVLIHILVVITNGNDNKCIEYLGKNSLYIYGIHRLLLFYIYEKEKQYMLFGSLSEKSLVDSLIMTVISIVVSLAITYPVLLLKEWIKPKIMCLLHIKNREA